MTADLNVYSYFSRSAETFPDHRALEVNESAYSYKELEEIVAGIAARIPQGQEPFVGLFAQKTFSAYAGILSVLKTGKGYVPMNPCHPVSRLETIRLMAGIKTIIADSEHLRSLAELLKASTAELTLLLPETAPSLEVVGVLNPHGRHRLIFKDGLQRSADVELAFTKTPVEVTSPDSYAYLLFTSGSTGQPKGVPVSHKNLSSFINHFNTLYSFTAEDRFSQSFDIGFDPSVQDIFTAWSNGATLCCLSREYGFLPGAFISKKQLTVWHSVPSIPRLMKLYGMLGKNFFPTLRYSMFGGEPLHEEVLYDWNKAAPNSTIDNLYGPTELTVTISQYRWDPENLELPKIHNGIVSIGKIYSNHHYEVIPDQISPDEQHGPADESTQNKKGELLVSGPQLVDSYYNNEEATRRLFIQANPGEPYWYRTGDLVMEDEEGDLFYLERIDNQIKINGNRVELGEIAHTIERMTGPQSCLLIPTPDRKGDKKTKQLVLFLLDHVEESNDQVIHFCKQHLPDYMIPKIVLRVRDFPLNNNGKIDIKRLMELYELI